MDTIEQITERLTRQWHRAGGDSRRAMMNVVSSIADTTDAPSGPISVEAQAARAFLAAVPDQPTHEDLALIQWSVNRVLARVGDRVWVSGRIVSIASSPDLDAIVYVVRLDRKLPAVPGAFPAGDTFAVKIENIRILGY